MPVAEHVGELRADWLHWERFLSARGTTPLEATAGDVAAYYTKERLDGEQVVAAATTWNRRVAALDKRAGRAHASFTWLQEVLMASESTIFTFSASASQPLATISAIVATGLR